MHQFIHAEKHINGNPEGFSHFGDGYWVGMQHNRGSCCTSHSRMGILVLHLIFSGDQDNTRECHWWRILRLNCHLVEGSLHHIPRVSFLMKSFSWMLDLLSEAMHARSWEPNLTAYNIWTKSLQWNCSELAPQPRLQSALPSEGRVLWRSWSRRCGRVQKWILDEIGWTRQEDHNLRWSSAYPSLKEIDQ